MNNKLLFSENPFEQLEVKQPKCSYCENSSRHKCKICDQNICDEHLRAGHVYGWKTENNFEYYCLACWRLERNKILNENILKPDIISGLKKLGVSKGDSLLVHSSLSSFGFVRGHADTVIDSLMYLVTKTGTLLMPTFTLSAKKYHPRSSRVSKSVGIIPEKFRVRFKTTRTNHKKLSFTAWGKNAIYLINNAIKYEIIDDLSPVGRLRNKQGKILLLGVDLNVCSGIRLVENLLYPTLNYNTCGDAYIKLNDFFKRLKSYKEILIGNALCRIFEIKEMFIELREFLKDNNDFLICGNRYCKQCNKYKRYKNI